MTRKKVKLEFIGNDSARKATFKKRKKGLLKKADELTTLCGVEACVIIYSPYDAQPEVWPNPSAARRVLGRFMNLSEEDQGKRMLNQEAYLKQRIYKVSQQLDKLKAENREREIIELMYGCINGQISFESLGLQVTIDLCRVIDRTLQLAGMRIQSVSPKLENY